jgi:dihydroorotate dehydrogenase electron transfer subunit
VTGPVARLLAEERFDVVFTCGPEPMQRIVASMARDAGTPCQVSLERLMACGIGACLSCVVSTRGGLKRACVDGPVFDAEEVVWDASQTPPKH